MSSQSEFVPGRRTSWTTIDVLPELVGREWNEITQAYLRAVRPSVVRVVDNWLYTTDWITWRVTVTVSDGIIQEVQQEVEVDLPYGVGNGYWLDVQLGKMPRRPI